MSEPVAPVMVLGVACAHESDAFGTRTWSGETAAGLTLHVTQSHRGWWLTVFRGVDALVQGGGDALEVAEEACERRAMERQALLASVRRAA